MKKVYLMLIPIVFLTYGCSTQHPITSPNQLNNNWKTSIAQFQITPIMPLRQNLEIGEVYRYFKRPDSFYSDGQIEPPIAYKMNLKDLIKDGGQRIWPTFTYEGNQKYTLNASIKSVGFLSGSIDDKTNISLNIADGYSKYIEIADIIKEFAEEKNGQWQIKDKDKMKYLINLHYRMALGDIVHKLFWKDTLYLRIPVEVYYAKSIAVSITKSNDSTGELKVIENNKLNEMNITMVINEKNRVVMNETFKEPMAIGYRGLLLKIRVNDWTIQENIEDLQ